MRSEGVGVGSPDTHSFIHSFSKSLGCLEDPQYAVEVDGQLRWAGLGSSTGEN